MLEDLKKINKDKIQDDSTDNVPVFDVDSEKESDEELVSGNHLSDDELLEKMGAVKKEEGEPYSKSLADNRPEDKEIDKKKLKQEQEQKQKQEREQEQGSDKEKKEEKEQGKDKDKDKDKNKDKDKDKDKNKDEDKEQEGDEEMEVGDIIIKPNFSEKIKGFFSKKIKNNLELLEADLIKDEVEIQFDWSSHLASFLLLFIIAFITVAEACVFFGWWGESKEFEGTNYLEAEIAYVNSEIERMKPEYDEAVSFSNRLRLSAMALDRHIYWTNFFSLLEANTLKNIYYRNFSGDVYGKYVLPAVSNNVLAINYQSKVFSSDEMVSSTEVSDENIMNTVDEEGVERSIINFNFNLNLNDRIFKE